MNIFKHLILLVIIFFFPLVSYSSELKIIDPQGLTRAVGQVKDLGVVEITLGDTSSEEEVTVTLVDSIGSQESLSQNVAKAVNKIVFQGVKEGLWQIHINKPDIRQIKQVQIK